ncbi:hypothetical protein C2857_005851 [Epichloe festucae Fl1]|uniref:Gti1/Pac2 family protein n=1 Tax=Epichloe festucae (strain Fl1) TaxID=877507 RepID=A0A7S9KPV2_EPIFF|nr:hypothetical protein C2857_005851 [Epichloe festucae Fl1]
MHTFRASSSQGAVVDHTLILGASTSPLIPSWQGYIASTTDALVAIEAYLVGLIDGIPRRPRYAEHHSLIKSGSVLIFEEGPSGIKRWTDGLKWGPSRVLGNFLIYRELDDSSNPIRKTTTRPKAARSGRKRSGGMAVANVAGSFGDWYQFKQDGLVKKTISVLVQGRTVHLVSYFTMEDIMLGRLLTPTMEPGLQNIVPRVDLFRSESIRKPIDGTGYLGNASDGPTTSTAHSVSRPSWEAQQWEFLHHPTGYHHMNMYSSSMIQ